MKNQRETDIFTDKKSKKNISALLAGLQREPDALYDADPVEDWKELFIIANRYEVAPLLYQRLVVEKKRQNLPPDFLQLLQKKFYEFTASNLRKIQQMGLVLEEFQNAGIPVILLKGIYLAEFFYENIGLRSMSDIDLMVPKGKLIDSLEVLEKLGYKCSQDFWLESELPTSQHLPFVYKEGKDEIEIHWTLLKPDLSINIDEDELWRRAEPIELENRRAWALSPEDLLLHICVHMVYGHELYAQLRSLCDIEVLLSSEFEIDWPIFAERAFEWKTSKGVFLALYLANRLLNAKVPGDVLEQLRPDDFSAQVENWAVKNIFPDLPEINQQINMFMGSEGWTDKLMVVLRSTFPSRTVMSHRYSVAPGSWKVYLLYPKHVFVRIGRYSIYLLRLIFGGGKSEPGVESQVMLLKWLRQQDEVL